MKKLALGLLAVIIVATLTGCGALNTSRKLICTKSYTESGLQMNEHVVTVFKGNKVVAMEIVVDATMEEYLLNYADTIKTALETQYKKYSDNGATTDVEVKDGKIHVKVVMDLNKMTEQQKKNLDVDNINGSYTANKDDFKERGYTCK